MIFRALALLLVACPAGPPPPTPMPVGAACTSDAGCESGLYCETRLPGGACTKDCTPCPTGCDARCTPGCGFSEPCTKGCTTDAETRCPAGAQCINVLYGTESAIRCLQVCDDASPCRAGWQCVRPEMEPYRVCRP